MEAEREFLAADKPREAIEMWVHQQEWDIAQRIAEASDPASVPDVLCAHAKVLAEGRDFGEAEALLLRARRPEVAVRMYKEAGQWDDALRIAEDYLPAKAQELRLEAAASLQESAGAGAGGFGAGTAEAQLQRARLLERAGDHAGAVDAFLSVTRDLTDDPAELEQARAGFCALKPRH